MDPTAIQCVNIIATLVTVHYVKKVDIVAIVDVPCERVFNL